MLSLEDITNEGENYSSCSPYNCSPDYSSSSCSPDYNNCGPDYSSCTPDY